MMQPASNRSPAHRTLLIVSVLLAAFVFWFISICMGVVRAGAAQELQASDAIVVFGAAEYSGRPSPVLRLRLDHAFELFQRGLAPVIITTGGSAADPSFSEGGVGHDYLMRRGVPDSSLIAETQGSDTAQSAERIAVIMRTNQMHSCLVVSDAYHVFRIRKLLEHQRLKVYIAPRPDSKPHSWWQRGEAILREAVSYVLWRLHITG
jgi:uncharacterized SAM-binding protein YcdF (DUF218 family)